MKIICGTDFSVHAAEAAEVAAALAVRSNSTLILVHAMGTAPPERLPSPEASLLRKKLGRMLTAEGKRLRTLGVQVLESLVAGTPSEALAAAAVRCRADLIIVSSLGQVTPMRWLIGSVAERTAQHSTVPTLVVRDHERLLFWAQGKRALKVFVGCDLSCSSDAAIRWVASLKPFGPRRVTIAYVSWPLQETWRFGIGTDRTSGGYSPEVRSLLERELKERCDALLDGEAVDLLVAPAWGRPDVQLIALAKAADADLMVVGTNQRRGLSRFRPGSVSRGILHHALTNVACVPVPDEAGFPNDPIPAYRRVLVPTDFSKLGNKAIASAYGAAQPCGEICLMHVVRPPSAFKAGAERGNGPQVKRKRTLAARLRSLVPQDAHADAIQTRVEVVEHEHTDAAICQAAERFGADLICMGSRGRSGIKKKLLGSVTAAVMRRSKRPVLVIRE